MEAADVVWGSLLVVGAVVEGLALWNTRPGDTLSERTRSWFRVNTRAGRVMFVVVWVGFAAWFLVHILG